MAKILSWMKVGQQFKKTGILIFRPWDLMRFFKVSEASANFFVYRNTNKGFLIRLKKSRNGSLYSFSDNLPNQYLVANCLYEPSYISFDTAMSFHGIIPETIYTLTSATTKTTRSFEIEGVNYKYFRIKRCLFTGYKPIRYKNTTILMADPEKAIVDYLYFINLKKRDMTYERINLKNLNRKKAIAYANLFGRSGVLNLLEELYAGTRKYPRIH